MKISLSLHALQKYWVSCLTFLLVQTRQGLVGLSFFPWGRVYTYDENLILGGAVDLLVMDLSIYWKILRRIPSLLTDPSLPCSYCTNSRHSQDTFQTCGLIFIYQCSDFLNAEWYESI